jgi:hypothetical protein
MTQCFEQEHNAIAPRSGMALSTAQKSAPEEERWPTTRGSSIGRWDGDKLIIETVSVSGSVLVA